MVEDIRELSKEEKIEKLIKHMDSINSLLLQSQFNCSNILSSKELYDIFEKLENKIHFIAPGPIFEFTQPDGLSRNINVGTWQLTIDDFIKFIPSNQCIIFYTVQSSPTIVGASLNNLNIRIALIDDDGWKSKMRDKKINQVLDEKSDIQ